MSSYREAGHGGWVTEGYDKESATKSGDKRKASDLERSFLTGPDSKQQNFLYVEFVFFSDFLFSPPRDISPARKRRKNGGEDQSEEKGHS